jgi:hypothetical protein
MKKSTQSRKMSFVEKVVETFIAFIVSVVLAPVFFELNGIESNLSQNINVVLCFTALAIIRGYIIRRLFNWIQGRE